MRLTGTVRVEGFYDFEGFRTGLEGLTTEVTGGTASVKGKCWPRNQAEPSAWTVQVSDSRANTEGSPALYGYVTGIPNVGPGTDIFYDNVRITPNKN